MLSSHRFGLAAASPNLSESNLAGWVSVLGFAALTLGLFGLATRALTAHPPNWVQTKLAEKRRDQTSGLIESCANGDFMQDFMLTGTLCSLTGTLCKV